MNSLIFNASINCDSRCDSLCHAQLFQSRYEFTPVHSLSPIRQSTTPIRGPYTVIANTVNQLTADGLYSLFSILQASLIPSYSLTRYRTVCNIFILKSSNNKSKTADKMLPAI